MCADQVHFVYCPTWRLELSLGGSTRVQVTFIFVIRGCMLSSVRTVDIWRVRQVQGIRVDLWVLEWCRYLENWVEMRHQKRLNNSKKRRKLMKNRMWLCGHCNQRGLRPQTYDHCVHCLQGGDGIYPSLSRTEKGLAPFKSWETGGILLKHCLLFAFGVVKDLLESFIIIHKWLWSFWG